MHSKTKLKDIKTFQKASWTESLFSSNKANFSLNSIMSPVQKPFESPERRETLPTTWDIDHHESNQLKLHCAEPEARL